MLTFYKLATFDPELRRRIAEAEAMVKADPSVKEQNSGVYPKGHVTIQGMDITIETAQGQWRRGVSKDGTPWEVKLSNSYGYIKGTDSAEPGDQMDVFLGPDPELEIVFVVDQNKGDTDVFDEVKVILGCRTASQAKQLYMTNYSVGWKGFRSITPLTVPQFKAWCAHGNMKLPLAGQQMASFYKVAAIDGHRVGMYGAIPIVGPAVAASSLNLQDRTRSRSLNSLRDWLLTTVGQGVGALAGGAAGQAMFGSPTSLIQRANQHLLNTGDVSGLSAFAAPVAGLAGSSALGAAIGGYGGGRLAAYLRSKDEADATPDPDKKLHSTLLALLSPTTASSLMEDRPLAIGTKGLIGTIAGSVVPFAGGALSHYLLHPSSKQARVLPGQKKEKDRATVRSRLFNAMPVAAGGVLAGGGLLELLRRSVFPAETVEDLQRFSEQAKLEKVMGHNLAFNAEQRPFQDLANYSVQGNRMLNNKVLGVDPLALVKMIRSGPWMPEKARWQADSGLHYDAFKKGPLSGGMRLLSELTTGWAPGNVPPAAVQGPELRDALMQAANADVAKQTGVQNYFDWKVGKPELWHHDAIKPDRLTTAQQIQVMRGWPAGLKANMPEAIKPQLDALGNTLAASDAPLRAGYNSITQPFLLANSTMRNVAAGLAGAGVLGLGAYGVGRYLDSRKDLERKKRRKVTATEHAMQFVPTLKQSAINGKALAGILAALGVGGYGVKKVGDGVASAGQFLASPEGQKVLAVHPGLRRALGVEFPHMDVNLGLDPTGTITGAAMGAGIGALTGVMHKEDEERPWWKSPTTGALIGAGLGGLYDYASMRGAQEMWNLQPKEQQDLLGMSGSHIRAGRQAVIN